MAKAFSLFKTISMQKNSKTHEELLAELQDARRRIAELELIEQRQARMQDELQRSDGQFRSLVDSTDDSIYVVDRDCRYLFMNLKHLGRLGMSGDAYINRSYQEFHSPEETAAFQIHIETIFRTGQSLQHEYQADRDKKFFLRTMSPVRGSGSAGAVRAVTTVSKEITDRKRMEEELRALSLTDELTGLYNRRGFFTLVQQQLRVASRLEKNVVLFGVDMDDLKKINDACGHQTGDEAIRDAADIIRKNFRESDIIARIGGDEFAVSMIENIDIDPARLGLRLQDILKIYNSQGTRPYTLSLSIGMTRQDPRQESSIEDILRRADENMYEQKRARPKDR
ncbi:MAG: GGDEF domain-containing protein [Nitrospirota bacterium]|nr:GGDEF domain-containing protein [Nitrospirota bacterium]